MESEDNDALLYEESPSAEDHQLYDSSHSYPEESHQDLPWESQPREQSPQFFIIIMTIVVMLIGYFYRKSSYVICD